jgi:hypothetical protein
MAVLLATDSSLSADPSLVVAPSYAVTPLPLLGDGAADLLATATSSEPVLLIVRPAEWHKARRAVVESFVDPTAVLTCTVSLSQLGARLLAHLLVGVEQQHGTTAAAELAGSLTLALQSQLMLSNVARLDDPPPSIGQHLRSWLPRASFQVLSGRRRAVVTGMGEPTGRRVQRPDERSLFTSSAGCSPALREASRQLAHGRACDELPPWPEPERQTSARWAELATWSPGEVQELVAAWTTRPVAPCRWCHRPSTLPVCASCGALLRPVLPVTRDKVQIT